jgi:hypothetical protein
VAFLEPEVIAALHRLENSGFFLVAKYFPMLPAVDAQMNFVRPPIPAFAPDFFGSFFSDLEIIQSKLALAASEFVDESGYAASASHDFRVEAVQLRNNPRLGACRYP